MSDLTIEETQDRQKVVAITGNAVVFSNIVELATSVACSLARSDAAGALGDASQTREVVSNTVANRIKEKLAL